MKIEICGHLNTCDNGRSGSCEGCNIYNMFYDEDALIDWCRQQKVSVVKTIINLHKEIGMELIVQGQEENMSNRFYVNDVQIFGNNEMFKRTYEELKKQGAKWDENGCFRKIKIKDPQALIDAVDNDSL